MAKTLPAINQEACNGDGICVEVCPVGVFEMVDKKARVIESRREKCITCGQCVAVCPSDAICAPDLPAGSFEKLEKHSLGFEDLDAFFNARRSVRNFNEQPVDRALIDKIVQAASTAPMGRPPHTTEILVIDDPDELDRLRSATVEGYRRMISAMKNPLIRLLIRWQVGAELFKALQGHVLPLAELANKAFEKDGTDQYMYRAPALMLFHADRRELSYEENAHLVSSYSMLAAHSLGLGSTIIGMIPPMVDRSKKLRERYGIPGDNKVITSLILGHPKYRYRKSVKREFPSVRFV